MSTIINNSFLTTPIRTLIWQNSMPMFTAIFLLLAYDIFESSLLALGSGSSLIAFGFTLPITSAMTAMVIALSIRSNNKLIYYACDNKELIPRSITSSFIQTFCILIPLSFLLCFFIDDLLLLLGSNNFLLDAGSNPKSSYFSEQTNYLTIRVMSWLFLALIWQVNAMLRALCKANLASNLMISWLVVKALLAAVFLVPNSPFYYAGLQGIALIHLLSDATFALASIYFLNKTQPFIDIDMTLFKEAFNMPKTPLLLVQAQQMVMPLSMAVITIIVAQVDTSLVAAFAFIFRLEVILMLLPMVLTTSMPAIIGCNHWAGNFSRVKEAYKFIFISIILLQLVIALIINGNYPIFSMWLCPKEEIAHYLNSYFIWVPFGYIGAGCCIVLQSCLNAKGKTIQATFIGIFYRFVLVIGMLLLSTKFFGEQYLFQALFVANLASIITLVVLIKPKKCIAKFEEDVMVAKRNIASS